MSYNIKSKKSLSVCQQSEEERRILNPADINIAPGYKIEVFAEGLNAPTSILFTRDGTMYIADSGYVTGKPSVSRLVDDHFEIIADAFDLPLIGITEYTGRIYASHKGKISIIRADGSLQDIITGLPSYGDFSNSKVAFGPDFKMYFGQGTATNSGVVGQDNLWVSEYPFFHDSPGSYIMLNGQNFETRNILVIGSVEPIFTGAFSPYGVANAPYEVRKGITKASGSILRSDPDGSNLELVAWGLRSPSYVKFDDGGKLYVSNNGCDIRGSRPIANAPDEFHVITSGIWYGWPDYVGGEPVTLPRFKPEGGRQPEFLLNNHPNIPPRPFAIFPPGSTIIGFEFNYNASFGPLGDIYIAEFGSTSLITYGVVAPQYIGAGHRISKIDIRTGSVTTFAINKSGFPRYSSGEGGFGRPADIAFGPDGAMYVVDMGISPYQRPELFIPYTGVIWKITRID